MSKKELVLKDLLPIFKYKSSLLDPEFGMVIPNKRSHNSPSVNLLGGGVLIKNWTILIRVPHKREYSIKVIARVYVDSIKNCKFKLGEMLLQDVRVLENDKVLKIPVVFNNNYDVSDKSEQDFKNYIKKLIEERFEPEKEVLSLIQKELETKSSEDIAYNFFKHQLKTLI